MDPCSSVCASAPEAVCCISGQWGLLPTERQSRSDRDFASEAIARVSVPRIPLMPQMSLSKYPNSTPPTEIFLPESAFRSISVHGPADSRTSLPREVAIQKPFSPIESTSIAPLPVRAKYSAMRQSANVYWISACRNEVLPRDGGQVDTVAEDRKGKGHTIHARVYVIRGKYEAEQLEKQTN